MFEYAGIYTHLLPLMEDNWGHYADFTEEQFAANESFQRWVLMPDSENETHWMGFLQSHSEQRVAVANARKLVEHLTKTGFHLPLLSGEEKTALREAIFRRLSANTIDTNANRLKKSPSRIWLVAAALVGTGFITALLKNSTLAPATGTVATLTTAPREIREIVLPDSSIVILNGNSSIQYNTAFNDQPRREIILNGNAYFKIKKTNLQQPFIVHANQLNISVTGTEFNVDARTKATDVVLTKGNINISFSESEGSAHRTFLSAGEKFRLDTLKREFITEKADIALYREAWENGEWNLNGVSMEELSVLINQFYGTEVLFKNNEARKLMITAVVSVHNLSNLLQVLEKTLNLTIKETPDSIVII